MLLPPLLDAGSPVLPPLTPPVLPPVPVSLPVLPPPPPLVDGLVEPADVLVDVLAAVADVADVRVTPLAPRPSSRASPPPQPLAPQRARSPSARIHSLIRRPW